MSRRDDDEKDLLKDPNKRIGDAKGVLAVFWRQFLMILEVDGWAWDKYMRRWLDNPRNGVPNNSRDRSSQRGNLNKELNRDDMTWKVFLKALNFLDPVRISFSVSLTFRNGKTHTVSARLKDRGVVLTVDQGEEPLDLEEDIPPEDEEIADLQASLDVPDLSRPLKPSTKFTPMGLVDALKQGRSRRSAD